MPSKKHLQTIAKETPLTEKAMRSEAPTNEPAEDSDFTSRKVDAQPSQASNSKAWLEYQEQPSNGSLLADQTKGDGHD